MAFGDELADAAADVISTAAGVAATTVTITQRTRSAYVAATGKRTETTGSVADGIDAVRSRQVLRAANAAPIEAVLYRVRVAALAFVPSAGDLIEDAGGGARRIASVAVSAGGTVYDIVVEAVHGEA